jgi:hypothetical protein
LLGARSVEIVGDEEDSGRAAAADQAASRAIGPPPGITPIPTSNWPSSVFSREANRRSQARTNSHVVVREVEVGVGADEDDDVEVPDPARSARRAWRALRRSSQ